MSSLDILTSQADPGLLNMTTQDRNIFTKVLHAFIAIYMYEWCTSLDFEWEFISGKKAFQWPMIFYFANRYILLFSVIGLTTVLDITSRNREINCQALYSFNQLTGNGSVGLASINLCIRTMIIWSYNRYIVGVFVVLILGHWSLILQSSLVSVWIEGTGCILVSVDNTIHLAVLIYAMSLDLTATILTAYKLLDTSSIHPTIGESRITNLIFKDGLIFFCIAFLANSLASIFMVINISPVFSIIFNAPAAILSTITSCRAVRRLKNFTRLDPKLSDIVPSAQTGSIAFRDKLDTFNLESKSSPKNGRIQTYFLAHVDVEEQDIGELQGGERTKTYQSDLEAAGNPLDHVNRNNTD